jgi:hypothetical protein
VLEAAIEGNIVAGDPRPQMGGRRRGCARDGGIFAGSLERFGLRFVASPRHADVLVLTGPVTKNMREALERT